MKNILLCIGSIFFTSLVMGQKTSIESAPTFIETLLQSKKPPLDTKLSFPIVSLGTGIMNFHGDIQNPSKTNFTIGSPAVSLELMQSISNNYNIGFRFLKGSVTGNANIYNTNVHLNFKTQITSFGTFMQYNFAKNSMIPAFQSKLFLPYASIGVELLQRAEAWGDYYTDTTLLYTWKDGTQRTIAESKYNASKSRIVYRDYLYETAMEQQNLDNIDFYSPITMGIPIEIGGSFNLSPKVKLNIGYQYHISLSDNIDNISTKGNNYDTYPTRKGNILTDAYSYTYINLSFNLEGKKQELYIPDTTKKTEYKEFWDEDQDGIDETEDDCPYTPKGVRVFANGCPLDDDKDGIPNYKDLEQNSKAFCINEKGQGILEQDLLQRMLDVKKVNQNEIYRFYPKLLNGGTIYRQFYKKIPNKYKILDLDKNEYIDIVELLHAINTFFDEGPNAGVGSQLSAKDLSELIEFFFLQF